MERSQDTWQSRRRGTGRASSSFTRGGVSPISSRASARGLQTHTAVRGKRLGVIGFSLGAFLGLGLVQEFPGDVAAVVLFYGTREGDYDAAKLSKTKAAFLGHFAETDEFESATSVADLEKVLHTIGK